MALDVRFRIVPGQIHMVPKAVDANQIPGVLHLITDHIAAIDPCPKQKILVCPGVAGADCSAVYQFDAGIYGDRHC